MSPDEGQELEQRVVSEEVLGHQLVTVAGTPSMVGPIGSARVLALELERSMCGPLGFPEPLLFQAAPEFRRVLGGESRSLRASPAPS